MLSFVVTFIHVTFRFYYFLLLANIVLSWFPMRRSNPVVTFVYEMTEPYLRIFRRIMPPSPRMPVDFSPVLAIFVLYFLESLAFRLLAMLIY